MKTSPSSASFPAPTRHPPDALLVDYTSGALSEAESRLISAHLECCEACRGSVRACEAIGGALLDTIAPAFLPPNLLNRTLAAIDNAAPAQPSLPARRKPAAEPLGSQHWRKLPGGFGIQLVECNGAGADIVVLLKAPAGKTVLRHRHAGEEWTVAMQGGFSDHTGHYQRGDFVILDDRVEHQPKADPGQTCICLILMRAMPIYTSLPGKLLGPFIRL